MTGAFLRFLVVELELVDEFAPTLDKEDPTYAVRMQGLEQMKLGLAQMVTGLLVTLTERDRYRSSELVRLLGYMQETLPVIAPHLPAATRAGTVVRLQQMQEGSLSRPGLRSCLGRLCDQRRAAIRRRGACAMCCIRSANQQRCSK